MAMMLLKVTVKVMDISMLILSMMEGEENKAACTMSNFVLAQPAHNRLGAGIAVAVIYVPLWLANIIHASANNATFKDR